MKIERREDGTVWVDGVLVPGAERDDDEDWCVVLSGVTHTAMDESGRVFAYFSKPSCCYDAWIGNGYAYLYTLPSGEGWEDSLREIGHPKQNVEHKQMTKEDMLDLLMLLSALESWSFAQGSTMPDYLGDKLSASITKLRDEVVK